MKCLFWCFKAKKQCFSQFLCTERQQIGLQNTQIRFRPWGFTPVDPPAGRSPCTQPGPRRPLNPSHLGSVLPKHFFQFPCPSLQTVSSHFSIKKDEIFTKQKHKGCALWRERVMIIASLGCLAKVKMEMIRMSTSYLVALCLLIPVRRNISQCPSKINWTEWFTFASSLGYLSVGEKDGRHMLLMQWYHTWWLTLRNGIYCSI